MLGEAVGLFVTVTGLFIVDITVGFCVGDLLGGVLYANVGNLVGEADGFGDLDGVSVFTMTVGDLVTVGIVEVGNFVNNIEGDAEDLAEGMTVVMLGEAVGLFVKVTVGGAVTVDGAVVDGAAVKTVVGNPELAAVELIVVTVGDIFAVPIVILCRS